MPLKVYFEVSFKAPYYASTNILSEIFLLTGSPTATTTARRVDTVDCAVRRGMLSNQNAFLTEGDEASGGRLRNDRRL